MIGRMKPYLLGLVVLVVSACGVSGVPERIVEDYLTAVAASDDVRAVNLSCTEWEGQARMDADSFMNVQTTIEEMHCEVISQTQTTAEVHCVGRIVADYQGENQTIDLSLQTYRLIVEDGVWRFCGNP
jgi:hypothetical protein